MTTDAFALLGQPRRPWLDPDALQDAFHRRSAESHPDVASPLTGSDEFAALNAAYSTLLDPRTRLRHLIELEFPDLATSQRCAPDAVGDLFLEVATALQSSAAFQKKAEAATSPISRALLASERMKLTEELRAVSETVATAYDATIGAVKTLDDTWNPAAPGAGERLVALQAELGFLSRWLDQTREGLFRLQG